MWGYRKIGSPLNGCYVSVDGTDCPIAEPSPFSRAWFSYKLRSAGLRYEVGISIESADIVWVSGPFQCGTMNDLSIFRQGMKLQLDDGERVIADSGYRDTSCITPDEAYLLPGRIHSRLRARHETVNARLKDFNVLFKRFRHDVAFHGPCFHAVANVTQLMLSTKPLFHVDF